MTYAVGPCAAQDRCRNWDRITQQAGDADRHALCDPCLHAAAFAVQALPRDWYALEQLLPPGARAWDGVRAHDGHPAPLNLAAEALQRDIWWITTAWEDVARDLHHLSPSLRGREGPAVLRACTILGVRLGALSDVDPVPMHDYPYADPDQATTLYAGHTFATIPGAQGVLDLIRLHQRSAAMLGLTSPVRHLPGVCPGCGGEDLRQNQPRFRGDEQFVYCASCDCVRSYDEYARNTGLMGAAA